MAIGAVSKVAGGSGDGPGGNDPIFANLVSFAGDGSYPTGGTAAFQAAVRAAIGTGRELIGIVPGNCGLFLPSYVKSTDKLLVRNLTDGTEVSNGTNLSGTTFNVIVLSK